LEQPRDGAMLWFQEFSASNYQLGAMVPPRSNLGVFEWEEERQRPQGE
jgi:hypothetical protein